MNQILARQFASEWIQAWNQHDLAKICAFYAEGCELSSPFIPEVIKRPITEIKGLSNIRRYWEKAFAAMPNISFELVSVMAGVDSIVITFYGVYNALSGNVFYFDKDNKIIKSSAFIDLVLNPPRSK